MSYFGETLKRFLEKSGTKLVQLSRVSGVENSKLSRLINGEQTYIDPADLEAICHAVSSVPREQAELIRAHLLDECHGPGANLIDILIRGDVVKEDSLPYGRKIKLSPESERAIETIRALMPEEKEVRDFIIHFSKTMSKKA